MIHRQPVRVTDANTNRKPRSTLWSTLAIAALGGALFIAWHTASPTNNNGMKPHPRSNGPRIASGFPPPPTPSASATAAPPTPTASATAAPTPTATPDPCSPR